MLSLPWSSGQPPPPSNFGSPGPPFSWLLCPSAPTLLAPHLVLVPASTPESQTLCVLPPKPSAASEIIGQVLPLFALASSEQPHRLTIVFS